MRTTAFSLVLLTLFLLVACDGAETNTAEIGRQTQAATLLADGDFVIPEENPVALCDCPAGLVCFQGGCVECIDGPCCNENHKFKSAATLCDPLAETQYRCGRSACGGQKQSRDAIRSCSGASAQCDGELTWGKWMSGPSCAPDAICLSNGLEAWCEPCAKGCTNGLCRECREGACCSDDGRLLGPDTVCNPQVRVQVDCADRECGEPGQVRNEQQMCNGVEASCSGSLTWSDWTSWDSCPLDPDCQGDVTCFDCDRCYACPHCQGQMCVPNKLYAGQTYSWERLIPHLADIRADNGVGPVHLRTTFTPAQGSETFIHPTYTATTGEGITFNEPGAYYLYTNASAIRLPVLPTDGSAFEQLRVLFEFAAKNTVHSTSDEPALSGRTRFEGLLHSLYFDMEPIKVWCGGAASLLVGMASTHDWEAWQIYIKGEDGNGHVVAQIILPDSGACMMDVDYGAYLTTLDGQCISFERFCQIVASEGPESANLNVVSVEKQWVAYAYNSSNDGPISPRYSFSTDMLEATTLPDPAAYKAMMADFCYYYVYVANPY